MGYRPARYPQGAPVLKPRDRHLLRRFSYGLTPTLTRQVKRAGGGSDWFEQQLDPRRVPDKQGDKSGWWPSLDRGPQEIWERSRDGVEGGWEVMGDYQRAVLMRRIHSRRQVLEVMTELWENHFNVPVNADLVYTWRRNYGDVLRRHALGSFSQLLQAAVTHPAMLLYLDAAVSTKDHPNENLGRELLELHTVGVGHYDEDDVKNSSRILTGWSVDRFRSFAARYNAEDHWTGSVQVLGFTDPNAGSDGRALTLRYLDYLAHQPATAQRVARKLAVKFVTDDPPQQLVDELASVYLAGDTQIKPVLRALVRHPAFRSAEGQKVRDPGEDVAASYRALRVRFAAPPAGSAGDPYGANAVLWQSTTLGTAPFAWPRPDGQPLDNASWATPSRLTSSMTMHWSLAGGWWPKEGVHYRGPRAWMPRRRIRFDKLVDHMCRQLLGQTSTAALLQACCQACDVGPRDVITYQHPVVRWRFHWLIGTLLDSPEHLTR
ncbi:DUF1800 domain-containing protein [Nocardioides sp. CBS4Y-1]|uniref:DUF1800 domain-containing protein n=2 Tax=Nocardioides acrostichi TaxID=2784339 RepID=A0A930V140_9ACTN|nr:DUF1800 domain-containing protein [Nocardioides acrostichi]